MNNRLLWVLIFSLVVFACANAPKQDKRAAVPPFTSQAQVLSPTDTPIPPSTASTPTPEPTHTASVEIEQQAGQSLEIVGRSTDSSWWQVSTPNGLGWVAAEVTTTSNVSENIPLVELPSHPLKKSHHPKKTPLLLLAFKKLKSQTW